MVDAAVRVALAIVNVAERSLNGLFVPFPAIVELALLYVPPTPGGPMIAIDVPDTANSRPPKGENTTHPVEPLEPRVNVPLLATVIGVVELSSACRMTEMC